jgi:hypothetical protein
LQYYVLKDEYMHQWLPTEYRALGINKEIAGR